MPLGETPPISSDTVEALSQPARSLPRSLREFPELPDRRLEPGGWTLHRMLTAAPQAFRTGTNAPRAPAPWRREAVGRSREGRSSNLPAGPPIIASPAPLSGARAGEPSRHNQPRLRRGSQPPRSRTSIAARTNSSHASHRRLSTPRRAFERRPFLVWSGSGHHCVLRAFTCAGRFRTKVIGTVPLLMPGFFAGFESGAEPQGWPRLKRHLTMVCPSMGQGCPSGRSPLIPQGPTLLRKRR